MPMSKTEKSRRELLKLLALGGVSLYLPSCWNSSSSSAGKAEKQTDVPLKEVASEEILEKTIEERNVLFLTEKDQAFASRKIGFNLEHSKTPKIIALPKNTKGVQEAMKVAIAEELKVAVRSGGHSFEGFSSIDGGMQIHMGLMNNLTLNSNNELVAEPGAVLKELYDYLLPKGRIVPAGSCGTVGLGGLTLGGGYGFFSRKMGLTCDQLLEVTFVDGEGEVHKATGDDELLWALKGGGNGNFGIVTKMRFKTHDAPASFTRYRFKAYKVNAERAKEWLSLYFKATKTLSDTCFAAFVLNYKTIVLLVTNYGDMDPQLQLLIDAFSALADKTDIGTPKNLAKSLKNYYGIQYPIHFKNASAGYYNDFGTIETVVDDLLSIVFEKRGLIYQINTLGGNINTAEYERQSCYPHRKFNYLSELQAYWEEGEDGSALKQRFERFQKIIKSHNIHEQYRNYPSVGFEDWESAYYGENYSLLTEIKAKYDPNDRFTQLQSVKLRKKV